jgi:hypothetical protein
MKQLFELTDAERLSPLWGRIEAYCADRIQAIREENDADLDQIATARKRGQIEAFKQILRKGKTKSQELPPGA